ncbi:MAG: PEP-CTERM sorting domain-containing protein [Phycisphaerales bacterium JB037]
MKFTKLAIASVAGLCAATAAADFDLQITEIWMGNEPGSNLSEDWIEITNFGTMTWTAAIDGDLWFDDVSADTGDAALMSGVPSIAPGESVIFVDGGATGAANWLTLWGFGGQVGSYEGAGLGQGGDAVAIWISAGIPVGSPDDFEAYPDANLNGGQSWDVVLGAFSTVGNLSNAFATGTVNDEGQPAIGSPGTIPAPGSLALLGLGGLAAARRRR